MKKRTLIITSALLLAIVGTTYAAMKYPYGEYSYGDKVWVSGDLSKSGLDQSEGKKGRPANVRRHDVKTHNAITGQETPYMETVDFDITEVLPTDNFVNQSGYHLIPLEEAVVKDWAKQCNGNADYVWGQVSKNPPHPLAKIYMINGKPWIPIGSVAMLSGGGNPTMTRVP